MHLLATIAVAIVALIHGYFGYLELFKFDDTATKLIVGQELADTWGPEKLGEFLNVSAILGGNIAVYNWLVALGLLATLLMSAGRKPVQCWVLASIIVAGIYGGYTTLTMTLYFFQALPAAIALILVLAFTKDRSTG